MHERIDKLLPPQPNPFISSPADLLAFYLAQQIALVPQFKAVFGEYIDGYMRMDYSERSLPALRIYNEKYSMEHNNWFEVGTLFFDVILPANLRRQELGNVPDIITGALVQQTRRIPFFQTMQGLVPGLNWLGEQIDVDKSLAFNLGGENLVPMAQLIVNFRVDLRQWDDYLTQNDRTVADPFQKTLANLELISTTIAGLSPIDGSDAGVDQGVETSV